MIFEKFIKYIESIGFEYDYVKDCYGYKKNKIELYKNYYHFYNGSVWFYYIGYNSTETGQYVNIIGNTFILELKKEFEKELRLIKLKELLG